MDQDALDDYLTYYSSDDVYDQAYMVNKKPPETQLIRILEKLSVNFTRHTRKLEEGKQNLDSKESIIHSKLEEIKKEAVRQVEEKIDAIKADFAARKVNETDAINSMEDRIKVFKQSIDKAKNDIKEVIQHDDADNAKEVKLKEQGINLHKQIKEFVENTTKMFDLDLESLIDINLGKITNIQSDVNGDSILRLQKAARKLKQLTGDANKVDEEEDGRVADDCLLIKQWDASHQNNVTDMVFTDRELVLAVFDNTQTRTEFRFYDDYFQHSCTAFQEKEVRRLCYIGDDRLINTLYCGNDPGAIQLRSIPLLCRVIGSLETDKNRLVTAVCAVGKDSILVADHSNSPTSIYQYNITDDNQIQEVKQIKIDTGFIDCMHQISTQPQLIVISSSRDKCMSCIDISSTDPDIIWNVNDLMNGEEFKPYRLALGSNKDIYFFEQFKNKVSVMDQKTQDVKVLLDANEPIFAMNYRSFNKTLLIITKDCKMIVYSVKYR